MTAHFKRLTRPFLSAAFAAAVLLGAVLPAGAADRHAGYYYPKPTQETYVSRAKTAINASRKMRIGFVIGVTGQQLGARYAPQYAVFAKGVAAEKMIIVALNDGAIATLYQARGLLAQLTAVSRAMPFMREMKVDDLFTFFDLAKLMGFTRITISDGESYAHQITLQ